MDSEAQQAINEVEISSASDPVAAIARDGDPKQRLQNDLIEILQQTGSTFEAANVWVLNQVAIPLTQGSGLTKFRYLVPENDFIIYNTNQQQPKTPDEATEGAEPAANKHSTVNKTHIHLCYAFNQTGTCSIPLVIFPTNELDANCTQALKNTTVIDETPTGDINETIFLKWFDAFLAHNTQPTRQTPVILLCNSMIPIKSQVLVDRCADNNARILYYPLDDQSEVFNKTIFLKFKDTWKFVLTQFAQKDNPHTQLSFLYVAKQVLRKTITIELIRECMREFLKLYRLPRHVQSTVAEAPVMSSLTPQTQPTAAAYSTSGFGNGSVFVNPDYVSEEITVVNCDDQQNNVSSFDEHNDSHMYDDDGAGMLGLIGHVVGQLS
jgi:hypothetical protein